MALVMPDGNPTPAQQGAYQNASNSQAYNQIGQAYQQYLNRPMSQQDFYSQTNQGRNVAQKNIDYAINNIRNSDEARAYQNSQNQPQQETPPQDTGGGGQSSAGNYPSAPNVPPTMSGPNVQQMMAQAAANAPQISSQYTAQQIRDFQGKQINPADYAKTIFSQFQNPTNMQVQQGRDAQLMHLLQNPESLSQTWQDQMFESQKDDALSLAKQFGLQGQQQLAGRGLSATGGTAQALQQQQNENLAQQLLAGRRDIATKAASQNFMDRLNVLGAAESGLSNDVSRGGNIFQNMLAGQSAQAGENRYANDYGLASQQAMAGNERDNYNSYLGGRSLQGQENRAAEQFRQSAFGLSQQARQAAEQNALQAFMGANNADLGWANYGLNADQQFLNYLNGY